MIKPETGTSTSDFIKITKLDAARRQLRTAIDLWCDDGDPVSIHALAYAAYEVIHAVSKKRNPNRKDLLFDSARVKDEGRKEFNLVIKQHANFFKHGDKDSEGTIAFPPRLSQTFILFAILGVKLCGEQQSDEELAFLHWLDMHSPDYLKKAGPDGLIDGFPINAVEQVLAFSKREFFERFIKAKRKSRV